MPKAAPNLLNRFTSLALLAGLMTLVPAMDGKNKKPKVPPSASKDEIQVVGHIPLANGPVRRFFATQHYSSYYLYAERESGNKTTLIDVTTTNQPFVLGEVSYPSNSGSDSLSVVAGTAALVTTGQAAQPSMPPSQIIRIMDFSDPQNPKVAREFSGVTAMTRDDRRGLIFVANADGVWILQQHLAEDPAVEKAYTDYVLYSH